MPGLDLKEAARESGFFYFRDLLDGQDRFEYELDRRRRDRVRHRPGYYGVLTGSTMDEDPRARSDDRGSELEAAEAMAPREFTGNASGGSRCPSCGRHVEAGFKFCDGCGTRLVVPSPEVAPTETRRGLSGRLKRDTEVAGPGAGLVDPDDQTETRPTPVETARRLAGRLRSRIVQWTETPKPAAPPAVSDVKPSETEQRPKTEEIRAPEPPATPVTPAEPERRAVVEPPTLPPPPPFELTPAPERVRAERKTEPEPPEARPIEPKPPEPRPFEPKPPEPRPFEPRIESRPSAPKTIERPELPADLEPVAAADAGPQRRGLWDWLLHGSRREKTEDEEEVAAPLDVSDEAVEPKRPLIARLRRGHPAPDDEPAFVPGPPLPREETTSSAPRTEPVAPAAAVSAPIATSTATQPRPAPAWRPLPPREPATIAGVPVREALMYALHLVLAFIAGAVVLGLIAALAALVTDGRAAVLSMRGVPIFIAGAVAIVIFALLRTGRRQTGPMSAERRRTIMLAALAGFVVLVVAAAILYQPRYMASAQQQLEQRLGVFEEADEDAIQDFERDLRDWNSEFARLAGAVDAQTKGKVDPGVFRTRAMVSLGSLAGFVVQMQSHAQTAPNLRVRDALDDLASVYKDQLGGMRLVTQGLLGRGFSLVEDGDTRFKASKARAIALFEDRVGPILERAELDVEGFERAVKGASNIPSGS